MKLQLFRSFPLIFILILSCTDTYNVTEVIDGDTFKIDNGETIRLLGINAPEMTDPGGDIAKDFLTQMILNKKVRLEKDITEMDSYDRLLRYVYCGSKSVNAEMIRAGLVETRFYPPDTLRKVDYLELEKVAVRNKKGLWAFPVFQTPDTAGIHVRAVKELASDQDIIPWQDAHNYYGKTKTVEGKIVVSNNTGKVCFLNFDRNWKKYFTAVIFSSDYDKFPDNPEDYYLNRKVRVTGLIKEYQGKPEIIVKGPDQIQIID